MVHQQEKDTLTLVEENLKAQTDVARRKLDEDKIDERTVQQDLRLQVSISTYIHVPTIPSLLSSPRTRVLVLVLVHVY